MDASSGDQWSRRLARLGLVVQCRVASMLREAFLAGTNSLSEAVTEEGGDRIYAIDRHVEPLLESEIADWPVEYFPLLLIAEGLGEDGRKRFGDPDQPLRYRVIVDPIDGTRMLMYDKRSAWFLAAVAEDRGEETSLADTFASVLVELPTTRQNLADVFLATRDEPTRGVRVEVGGEPASLESGTEFPVRPCEAADLQDGFATVSSFFPGTRRLAAELAERIAEKAGMVAAVPNLFDDQYISTGGQMVQLMTGRDRCVLDLRPEFNRMLGRSGEDRFIESHPYDLAGLLALEQAGVVVTDPSGESLEAPLDVSTGVGWCGYANEKIRSIVEPVVLEFLRSSG
jgi:fructose-1,6-bisphosphatase/inositol monophosphatase family enzyme